MWRTPNRFYTYTSEFLAEAKLLPCDHEVMGSSPGNSLLQKYREKLRTIDPKWSDTSLDPAQAGATCSGLSFFYIRISSRNSNGAVHIQFCCESSFLFSAWQSLMKFDGNGDRLINGFGKKGLHSSSKHVHDARKKM